ncbi:C6 finger domain protein [Paecilomyces variotii No. 5]|uniref:C6 finger domain protein n=1 Tax=Byssochlamys spectabilis (strain No. 5 / NBRC 109023) TaxID=1356009 RepID=V5G9Z5_BYSSN|nr:C6 finger domain protein [Paecilomyces variotii No. 5]
MLDNPHREVSRCSMEPADISFGGSRRRRVGSSKSKSGCLTCKIRRVKCDEAQPTCHRCSSTGRKCEYRAALSADPYSPNQRVRRREETVSTVSPATSLLSASTAGNKERRAFHFFFHHISPRLAGALDRDLWRGAILQISRSQPAIWDAVIAISCLYEHPPFSNTAPVAPAVKPPVIDPNHRLALTWYSRALSNVRNQLDKRSDIDPAVALLSCVLFICVEILQENILEALQLYQQGLQLICSLNSAINSSLRETEILFTGIIVPLFYRLGILSIFYGHDLPAGWPLIRPHGTIISFQTLSDARTTLYSLLSDVVMLARACTESMQCIPVDINLKEGLGARQTDLRLRLFAWHQTMVELKGKSRNDWDDAHCCTYSLLQMAYATSLIVVETCLDQDEMAYDYYRYLFQEVIEHAPSAISATAGHDGTPSPFTFELGASYPLFFTAQKCRDPIIRRQALDLLMRTPRVEGLHRVVPSTFVAANIIGIEEGVDIGEDGRPGAPWDVNFFPGREKRIGDNLVFYPNQDRSSGLHMKFKRHVKDSRGTWHLAEEIVRLKVSQKAAPSLDPGVRN